MLFNSVAFAIFLPIVTTLYFVLPPRTRWLLLLIASCAFYMAFVPAYILILLLTIAVDYVAGIVIENAHGSKRKLYLAASIVTNLGVLFVFKYYNFFVENLTGLAHIAGFRISPSLLGMVLPIGLSFHTFQAMSYTIEVYRGAQRAERHLGIYALYVMYYPQLVAGPIERPQNLLPQFHVPHAFDAGRARDGLILILWGMFKKIVVADRLAPIVDAAFAAPEDCSGPAAMLACYAFSFQIYCDFSGYSDVARGCSRMMGIDLMLNFDHPYGAPDIAEFWRRWHVSLSTWFRDYLYVPLGGNRGGLPVHLRNIAIVFVLSGLWHGANWTFLVWGALHAVFLMVYVLLRPQRAMLNKPLRVFLTFQLVTLAWVFFRATSLGNAIDVLEACTRLRPSIDGLGVSLPYLVSLVALATVVWLVEAAGRGDELARLFVRRPRWQRWALYYGLGVAVLALGRLGAQQFIYFQF